MDWSDRGNTRVAKGCSIQLVYFFQLKSQLLIFLLWIYMKPMFLYNLIYDEDV